MAYRFKRDFEQLRRHGFGSLAHVPFLLSSDLRYLDEFNQYLVERSEGAWHPNRRDGLAFGRVTLPSANTMSAYSADLENWATYLEQTGGNWRTITYQELLATYDADMFSGRWSTAGRGLSPSTINRRVDRAVEFMVWAADRGLRPAFLVVTTLSARSHHSRGGEVRAVQFQARTSRHHQHPKRLRLPEEEEVQLWLDDVCRRSGPTLSLMCETVLQTGMRLEEVVHLREWQLPDLEGHNPGRPVRMEIRFGTKGGRRPGDLSLQGKVRHLRFDETFHQKLLSYRDLRRKVSQRRSAARRGTRSDRLFLSERTGAPIQSGSFYRAWRTSECLPFEGFSPHLGRHYFACTTLMRLIRQEQSLRGSFDGVSPASSIEVARTLVSTYLRPVLGHMSVSTTELYLDWVADQLWTPSASGAWSSFLEG
ncbi:site-specific integrase [Brevundimonas diminuta]|uniref:tyrosine-type recombinase/integrase n=1 Tax=Brevundimonas diminuta TaxID=293 RepID=UPI0030FAD26D